MLSIRQMQTWRDRRTGALYDVMRTYRSHGARFVELVGHAGGRTHVAAEWFVQDFDLVEDPFQTG